MAINTFKRNELKFIINEAQYRAVKEELVNYMELDKFCKNDSGYMIYNLYFDTKFDEVILKSIEKPYYKEKLRMRSYKSPVCNNDIVFLELKKKIGGTVSKRRSTITYGQAKAFLDKHIIPEGLSFTSTQVLYEILNFLSRYNVKPKVYLSYERVAYFSKDNRNFRVTFDKNIITRRENVDFCNANYGCPLLSDGKYLMEVKTDRSIPLWLTELLSKNKIYKTGFSKYGTEYKKYQNDAENSSPVINNDSFQNLSA